LRGGMKGGAVVDVEQELFAAPESEPGAAEEAILLMLESEVELARRETAVRLLHPVGWYADTGLVEPDPGPMTVFLNKSNDREALSRGMSRGGPLGTAGKGIRGGDDMGGIDPLLPWRSMRGL
jgi:hypothetical protein